MYSYLSAFTSRTSMFGFKYLLFLPNYLKCFWTWAFQCFCVFSLFVYPLQIILSLAVEGSSMRKSFWLILVHIEYWNSTKTFGTLIHSNSFNGTLVGKFTLTPTILLTNALARNQMHAGLTCSNSFDFTLSDTTGGGDQKLFWWRCPRSTSKSRFDSLQSI